jgi:hypothetical protein
VPCFVADDFAAFCSRTLYNLYPVFHCPTDHQSTMDTLTVLASDDHAGCTWKRYMHIQQGLYPLATIDYA